MKSPFSGLLPLCLLSCLAQCLLAQATPLPAVAADYAERHGKISAQSDLVWLLGNETSPAPTKRTGSSTAPVKEENPRLKSGMAGIAAFSQLDEQTLGAAVAIEITSQGCGLLREEAAQARVTRIGLHLAGNSSRPRLPWRFAILDTGVINSFATPGGTVFITRGLLSLCTDDALLAAVLAHEITHLTGHHALWKVSGKGLPPKIDELRSLLDEGKASSGDAVVAFDDAVDEILACLTTSGFPAECEFDTDARAQELCEKSGYKSDAMKALLSHLREQCDAKELILPTHPQIKERLRSLAALAKEKAASMRNKSPDKPAAP